MKVILQIRNGPDAGKEIIVLPGESRRVGCQSPADTICPGDSKMSVVHFVIECFSQECRIRDLKSKNGTLVNDVRVRARILANGDRVRAGNTEFRVRVEGGATAGAKANTGELAVSATGHASAGDATDAEIAGQSAEQKFVLRVLRDQPEPLFAILDAARDARVLDLLRNSKEHYESLYEGKQGEELANFAPYLVELPKDSQLLVALVKEGWGKSWGIYLTCKEPLKEVRKHFRHFLLVELENREEVYFRFYDPRVLKLFLPTCMPEEAFSFFGQVTTYFVEDSTHGALLVFVKDTKGTQKKSLTPPVVAAHQGRHVAEGPQSQHSQS